MMYVRGLNEEGEVKFRKYLKEVKEYPRTEKPDLNQKKLSQDLTLEGIEVNINPDKQFETKMKMAKYLSEGFEDADVDFNELIEYNGLWSWLAYIFFDQLCPVEDGERSLGQTERYICGKSYKSYSKHLVAFPYYVYTIHDVRYSKPFLDHSVDYVGNITEQIGSRKYIMSSKSLVKVVHKLYWDEEEGIKEGVASRKGPGTFRRFGKVIEQLKINYDLHGMPEKQILNVLPSEFDRWLED